MLKTERARPVTASRRPSRSIKPIEQPTYSTEEVSRLTGASMRQLQWWHEREYVFPVMGRHERQWSAADVLEVRFIRQIRQQGIPWRFIWSLMRALRHAVKTGTQLRYAVTEGAGLWFSDTLEGVGEIALDAARPVVVADLDATPEKRPQAHSARL